MAAAAVLQPNQSFEMSSMTGDVSQARQRRRRTTRRSDGSSKTRKSSVDYTQGESLNLDLSNSLNPGPIASEVVSSVPASTPGSIDSVPDTDSQLGETARQRRRTRLKKRETRKSSTVGIEPVVTRPASAQVRPLPELEDSTAGVASLLQKKLDLTESEENRPPGEFVSPQIPVPSQEHVEESAVHRDHGGTDLVEQEQAPLPMPDRPLPRLVPIDAGSIGSHDQESDTVTCTDILGITIHGTDHLKASVKISHPCIRVTVVDVSLERRGELAKKSRPDRCVTSFYERGNPNVDYILPVLTQPFNCSENSESLQPNWEETLLFNEQLTHFTANDNIVIFFELLDFSTINTRRISRQNAVANSEHTPWYRIAWGFIKPAGKVSKSQMGQKSRVQLYRFPKQRFKSSTESKEVYDLWSEHYRTAYPSTLYVTLKALPSENGDHLGGSDTQPVGRSMVPTLREMGTLTFEQLAYKQQHTKSASSLVTQPSMLLSETTRLPGQACCVPTTHSATLRPTKMGCSIVKFSNSGRLLAAGCADHDDLYPLIIYEVPSFQPVFVAEGHKGIIYDMSWEESDNLLATASGDGLVKLWSMSSPTPDPTFTLPHPCYVYSVCFAKDNLIFTGAYDGNIRLWSLPRESTESPHLLFELRGHSGLVNTLLWSGREETLYAGDSRGEVGVWRERQGEWHLNKRINAVKACALTSMSLHPNGRKLLLHTVRGGIVMVDLRIDRVCCEYSGISLSQSQHCSSVISPCGRLLFAGGQQGEVHVWNTDNGKPVHIYTEDLPISSIVSSIAYHPSEHMAVFSAYGSHKPIVVLTHKVDHSALRPKTETRSSRHRSKTKKEQQKEVATKHGDEELKSSMPTSARLSEVARTLSKVTAFVGSKTSKS